MRVESELEGGEDRVERGGGLLGASSGDNWTGLLVLMMVVSEEKSRNLE